MTLIFNGPYVFSDFRLNPVFCLVRVYTDPRGQRPGLVVVSEDPRNLGSSPFDCAEQLSFHVCRVLSVEPDTVWHVEHLAALAGFDGHPFGSERYRVVFFGTDGKTPRRRVVGRADRTRMDVERLAGGELAPLGKLAGAQAGKGRP